MFKLFSKKKEKKIGSGGIKFDVETMESDMDRPFKRKDLEIRDPNSKKVESLRKKREAKKVPKKETSPAPSSSPFLTDKVTAIPDQPSIAKEDIPKKAVTENPPQSGDKSFLSERLGEKTGSPQQTKPPSNLPIDSGRLTSRLAKKSPQDLPLKKPEKIKPDAPVIADKRINKPLLIVALIVLLLTAGAGIYYYFFVFSKPTQPTPPSPPTVEPPVEPVDPIIEPQPLSPAEVSFPNEEIWQVSGDDFITALKGYVSGVKTEDTKRLTLQNGIFVKPQESQLDISSIALIEKFGLPLTDIDIYLHDEARLFFDKTAGEDTPVKVSLILFVDPTISAEELIETMKVKEPTLLSSMLPLFVDETAPVVPQVASFKASVLSPSIRYFNYLPEGNTQSVDWGVVDYQDNRLLLITTSMQSTRVLLTALGM